VRVVILNYFDTFPSFTPKVCDRIMLLNIIHTNDGRIPETIIGNNSTLMLIAVYSTTTFVE